MIAANQENFITALADDHIEVVQNITSQDAHVGRGGISEGGQLTAPGNPAMAISDSVTLALPWSESQVRLGWLT
jgi:hypothetical protein